MTEKRGSGSDTGKRTKPAPRPTPAGKRGDGKSGPAGTIRSQRSRRADFAALALDTPQEQVEAWVRYFFNRYAGITPDNFSVDIPLAQIKYNSQSALDFLAQAFDVASQSEPWNGATVTGRQLADDSPATIDDLIDFLVLAVTQQRARP